MHSSQMSLHEVDSIYTIILWLPPSEWMSKFHMVRCTYSQWPHFYHTVPIKDQPFSERTISSHICHLYNNMLSMSNAQLQQYANHKATILSCILCKHNSTPIPSTAYYNIALAFISGRLVPVSLHITQLQKLDTHYSCSSWNNIIVNQNTGNME